jgi:hypothetical protein
VKWVVKSAEVSCLANIGYNDIRISKFEIVNLLFDVEALIATHSLPTYSGTRAKTALVKALGQPEILLTVRIPVSHNADLARDVGT